MGQRLRIDLPYAGTWPALLDWQGVDEVSGASAWVTVTQAGEHLVQVAGLSLSLQVQPAANSSQVELLPALKAPFPEAGKACFNSRFPTMTGPWVVGCEAGLVARAWHVQTREERVLSHAVRAPGVGDGTLYAQGVGLWDLETGGFSPARPSPVVAIAPPGVGTQRVAVLTQDTVVTHSPQAKQRWTLTASPASWYPPAVSEQAVVWVDRRESLWTGLDLYRLSEDGQSAVVLAREPGDQRHVAASEHWVGWIQDDAVVVEDLRSGERRRYAADAHSSKGLSLWGSVACWEQFNGQDMDALCSDGLIAAGPGHQRRPARYGPWLFYVDQGRPMVATARALVWDDDDPRAQALGPRLTLPGAWRGAHVPAGVRYDLPTLSGSWQLELWQEGAWVSQGPYDPTQAVTASDAVRLVPAP